VGNIGKILNSQDIWYVLLALVLAAVVSLLVTPLVKMLSVKMGAVDVPKDSRRMHAHPIPRMGGLAIFLGFIFAVLVLVPLNTPKQGMLLGAVIIVVLGIFDDIYTLSAKLKFLVQIVAALIAALAGNQIEVLSNPNFFSDNPVWNLGILAIPVTVIWIVAVTNAVNLIDGLDGLACGVSTISSASMLIIALLVSATDVAMVMAALAGACIGFFLGFIMATMSVQGMFKVYNIISFVVPFLMLGLPIFDVCFAVVRRLSKGQNPMRPDRGHVHHRLIDMGFSQKQAVGVLYVISAILGLSAVVLTASGALRAMLFLAATGMTALIAWQIFLSHDSQDKPEDRKKTDGERKENE